MKQVSWKFLAVAVAVLGVVGGGLFYSIPSTDAALSIPPQGFINPCAGFKEHPILSNDWPDIFSRTDGGIVVEIGQHFTTSDGRHGANLIVRELRSSGVVDGVGRVEIGFDASRGGRSTIVANQRELDYPATQTMRFFPTVTIEGKQYRALNAANLTNSEVKSTPPPVGTSYALTNEVKLEDVNKPGEVAMIIKPSRAFTVTGHEFK
ncbi:MAG TPA: hypothetical protein VLE27_01435 [Thermoanaerobaculia bacterium]|nr:hypothetical protein [Thermoanaerobaculia bacterium]